MSSTITYNEKGRYFALLMKTSYYALAITDTGEIMHVGSGPLPEDMIGASGDAPILTDIEGYDVPGFGVDFESRRWEFPTFGDMSYHDVALKVTLPCGVDGIETLRDLRLRYVDHQIRTDAESGFAPPSASRPNAKLRQTLCIHLSDLKHNLLVVLYYRVTPEYDIIERWVTVSNQTARDVEIESLAFGTVHLPHGRYELTRTAGTWAGEFIERSQKVEAGRVIMESQMLTTSHAMNPFYLLSEDGAAAEESGKVFFGALAYSGNWSLRFEAFPNTAMRVHGGYDPSIFAVTLHPGESHTTPAFVHGCSLNGRGGASRRLHAFARDYVLPADRHGEFRPVLYNSWEATRFDLTAKNQIELARKAAKIGVELFCVDDGWFGARRNDRAGLGDWAVSPDVFPNGLNELIDEVKRLGMRFGIWVEPEMVNPDSDLYRAHPDWVLHYPDRPQTQVRNQYILDYGRPEVVEYIWGLLDKLAREYDISFFKWDMNRQVNEPGSVAGDEIFWRHVKGVYGIMDRLRAEHPNLEIQSSSGGGGRIDLGMLSRVEQVWLSDNTDAYDRTRIQDGYSLAYPPRAMECWVTDEMNHQTGRFAALDLRFDVAMRGALGVGCSLNDLSDEELAIYAKKIAFYKRIRPVVQDGDLYRLRTKRGESTWLFAMPDGSRAVFSQVVTEQLQGMYNPPDRLPGLISNAKYNAIDEDGHVEGTWTGFQLATIGLLGDKINGAFGAHIRSRTILLEKIP